MLAKSFMSAINRRGASVQKSEKCKHLKTFGLVRDSNPSPPAPHPSQGLKLVGQKEDGPISIQIYDSFKFYEVDISRWRLEEKMTKTFPKDGT